MFKKLNVIFDYINIMSVKKVTLGEPSENSDCDSEKMCLF